MVSSLHHPNIVAVVASHEELGLLAMEFMAGGTLADRARRAAVAVAGARLGARGARGLEAAHAHGVIHRDFKPANIFFAASGEAKLGDFGVAHLVDLGATQTAGFIGTLAYMSPEQISGAPLTFAADVYALGVTLFQALTGRLPFGGPDFVGQHLGETRAVRRRAARPSSTPRGTRSSRARCEKSPADRFALARRAAPRARRHRRRADRGVAGRSRQPARAEPTPRCRRERYAITAELDGGLVQATDTQARPRGGDRSAAVGRRRICRGCARSPVSAARACSACLRLERVGDGTTRVVYEALTGRTPRPPSLTRAEHALLARALAPLHAAGIAHGSVATSLVLEDHGPALLTAGRRPSGISVEEELRELAGLVAEHA